MNSKLTTAYRFVVERLRRHPGLAMVDDWYVFEGEPQDTAPMGTTRTGVRLVPVPEPVEPVCTVGPGVVSYATPLTIRYEARVPGTNTDDALDLAAAIAAALQPDSSPGSPDPQAFRDAGISRVEWTNDGGKAGLNPSFNGTIRLVIFQDRVVLTY